MPTVNEELRDRAIAHSIFVERYGRGLARDIVKLLNSVDDDLVEKIAGRLAKIKAGGATGEVTNRRILDLLAEVRAINENVYKKVGAKIESDLTDLSTYEGTYHAGDLENALPTSLPKGATAVSLPSARVLKDLVTNSPIDGYLLGSWTNSMSANRLGRLEGVIRTGIAGGETIDQMVGKIRGTKANGYRGVLQTSRKSAETLAITASSTVSNRVKLETYRENNHIVKALKWVSTLDTHTSPVCQSRDGKVWPVDEDHPIPPAHPRCRSIITPVTLSYRELGIDRDDVDKKTRASMDGLVPNSTTYEDFLRSASPERQAIILDSEERAALFRDGKVSFKELFRDDGSYYTLAELKRADGFTVSKSIPAPKPTLDPYRPPAKVKLSDISVEPRLANQKALTADLTKNAKDARYEATPEFNRAKASDFGKASFSADFSDEAVSMIRAIAPEIDELADRFSIPRLRGYKSISSMRTNASMGDGLLSMNPAAFNAFSGDLRKGGASVADELIAAKAKLSDEMRALADQMDEIFQQVRALGLTSEKSAELLGKRNAIAREYNKKVTKANTLARKISATTNRYDAGFSEWKPGDPIKDRPFSTKVYFKDGLDKMRTLIYHEFGHHVHQMFKKVGPRRLNGLPPIENELRALYRDKFKVSAKAFGPEADRQASGYALANEHEWFAENFALYMMDRRDLVDGDVKKLIERMLDEAR